MTEKTTTKGGFWDRLSGNWKQFSGEVRKQWGDLTDDDLEYIAGERTMEGRLQERYGIAKDDANRQIDKWSKEMKL